MATLKASTLTVLKEVVKLPTAPFREEIVQEYVFVFARQHGLSARSDRFGNILVEYLPPASKVGTLPGICFNAHMDHPGFEVLSFDPVSSMGEAEFRGGTLTEFFPGCELLIYSGGAWKSAKAVSQLPPRDPERKTFQVFSFEVPNGHVEPGSIGTFDVQFAQVKGDRLYTKSADDLAQVALILAWLADLSARNIDIHAYGLLTRAEEVGFVGASGALETGLMPEEDVPLIVLECSKSLSGVAEIGAGPVLRVGDAGTVYDPDVDAWMVQTASEMRKSDADAAASAVDRPSADVGAPGFVFQRALMSGGVCEAGLFTLVRRRVGALALPLGNYHNIGAGPNPRPEPEIISLSDAANQLRLMHKLATEPFSGLRDGPLRDRLRNIYDQHAVRLEGNRFAKSHVGPTR